MDSSTRISLNDKDTNTTSSLKSVLLNFSFDIFLFLSFFPLYFFPLVIIPHQYQHRHLSHLWHLIHHIHLRIFQGGGEVTPILTHRVSLTRLIIEIHTRQIPLPSA